MSRNALAEGYGEIAPPREIWHRRGEREGEGSTAHWPQLGHVTRPHCHMTPSLTQFAAIVGIGHKGCLGAWHWLHMHSRLPSTGKKIIL